GDGVVVRGDDDGGGGCGDEVMMLARCGGLDGGDEPAVMAAVVRGGAIAIWWQPWEAAVTGRWRWCRSMVGCGLGWRGWPDGVAGKVGRRMLAAPKVSLEIEGRGESIYLEVAFRSNTCYVRNLQGDDLLTGGRDSNLYTISISDMAASSPVCLMSKATSTKSWLWHRRLSHLNFGTINDLTRLDLVDGLPKFKYGKDHLCSAREREKSKKAFHPPKLVPSDHSKLELLHMDLCGLIRVASINGKKYILMIVDDCSRYTWVYFLHSKDETPEIIKKFIAKAQLNYKAKVCKIHTDNGTEFKNTSLKAHYEKLGIIQQFSIARTP
ncbi:retrovirus-related pol polyprotein from transposon TNT 1-94, partial [Tanacetum coccineum]